MFVHPVSLTFNRAGYFCQRNALRKRVKAILLYRGGVLHGGRVRLPGHGQHHGQREDVPDLVRRLLLPPRQQLLQELLCQLRLHGARLLHGARNLLRGVLRNSEML